MARIYRGNLSRSATASDVRHAFVVYGKVLNVDIVRDDATGDPRGFGLVEITDDMEAATAIRQLNHCRFRGQSIAVHKTSSNTG